MELAVFVVVVIVCLLIVASKKFSKPNAPNSTQIRPVPVDAPSLAEPEKPRPTALIATTWVLWAAQFIPMGQVGYAVNLGVLVCSVFLLGSKNRVGKTNGWIVLIVWIISNLIAFFVAFEAASRRY